MINRLLVALVVVLAFLPFLLLLKLNNKANLKKEIRYRQFFMPIVSVCYAIITATFCTKIGKLLLKGTAWLIVQLKKTPAAAVGNFLNNLIDKYAALVMLVLVNTVLAVVYVSLKASLLARFRKEKDDSSNGNKIVNLFYEYSDIKEKWFVKNEFGQSRTFLKIAYYGGIILSMLSVMVSCSLYLKKDLMSPYYPVFSLIIIGELAFFLDGFKKDELPSGVAFEDENATHNAFYFLLRNSLKKLFGDKLFADGTTTNDGDNYADSIEDILTGLENTGGHIGKNYYDFIKQKEVQGLKANADYVKSGYDLATGKSLLFNTPFYYKLIPYVFYAMNRTLLDDGKILIVLGRHGTTDDLYKWCQEGLFSVSNIPDMWDIQELNEKEDAVNIPDVGIITRSGVHNLNLHRANKKFLSKVRFVFLVEPSRLVTTAQVGLSLLVKCFDQKENIVYCSVDKNCDGLVDSLSHILSANLTEVSPTEYAHGVNSYMCWLSDKDYIQHRLISGVSRYLGMGTELSFVALKNQVETTSWFGGDAYPVIDQYWISKQYYHDLLKYAELPTTQETYDNYFHVSYNLCDEKVRDNVYITVEDEQNNLFEMKRIFATIAEEQGFVNVISSEYMLREYMAQNENLFNADPKAIPYVAADFARTKRNVLLVLCLRLSIEGVPLEQLKAELELIGVSVGDLDKTVQSHLRASAFWNALCWILDSSDEDNTDEFGNYIIEKELADTKEKLVFKKDDVLFVRRAYNEHIGKFEDICVIDNADFQRYVLQDLEHARYVAERDAEGQYLGTELVGHILQKYLPGQLLTLNGKYYEMMSIVRENQVLLRRASEHIKGRPLYRQERVYVLERINDSTEFGALKTVNGVNIYYQNADFCVETPAYWAMEAYNDFETARKVAVSSIPKRRYFNKQILKIDFSNYGEAFTDKIKVTLTLLMNEVFRTMYAENQAYIAAVTSLNEQEDSFVPLTYRLKAEGCDCSQKAIYLIEDSQLDIGLLVSVERNLQRILQIISDYLVWNSEMIEKSNHPEIEERKGPAEETSTETQEQDGDDPTKEKKEKWWKRLFKRLFGRKKKNSSLEDAPSENAGNPEEQDVTTEADPEKAPGNDKARKKAERKAQKEKRKAEKAALKQKKKEEKSLKKEASPDEGVDISDQTPIETVEEPANQNEDKPDEIENTEEPAITSGDLMDENTRKEDDDEPGE